MHIFLLLICSFLSSCSEKEKDMSFSKSKKDICFSPDEFRKILEEEQKAAFNYFYDGAEPLSGLALEGNERGNTITTGGSGFGIMALIVGTEREWITREQSVERMLQIVRFLGKADRFKGVWSHWMTPEGKAHPFGDQVNTGDLVETSFLMAGLLAASEYYNNKNKEEIEICDSISSFWKTIDWNHYTGGKNVLHWLWYSDEDRLKLEVKGWNECMVTYLLALSAPKGISEKVYKEGWLSNGKSVFPDRLSNNYLLPLGDIKGGPLFFSHYSFLGYNPFLMQDDLINYSVQNISHTMLNRHYCIYEAPSSYQYSSKFWGLTACYGAGSSTGYGARSPKRDDGVLAPTAAVSSIAYTPYYSAQVINALNEINEAHGAYGLADSFKPSEMAFEKKHLAIDQGPIVVMIENYRTGLIWNLFMRNKYIKESLQKAGMSIPQYAEGLYFPIADTNTGIIDLLAHPDSKNYELFCYCEQAGDAIVEIQNADKKNVFIQKILLNQGSNKIILPYSEFINIVGKYTLNISFPSGKQTNSIIILH